MVWAPSTGQQRYIISSAMLIPLVWSAVVSITPASPAPMTPGEPIASLAFDQYLVNLRDVGLQPILEGRYYFENVGSQPLSITRLEPSCGCLSPRLAEDKRTYTPGERGFFVVGVATANEAPGPHTYTVKVHYEDPQPRQTVVKFKLRLPQRKVTVEPRELAFFQYSGTPNSRAIQLTDYRGNDIQVTRAVSTAEFIDVEVQEAEVDENGNRRVPILLSVPGVVPPGRTRSTVTIETSDPEFKTIRIPVLVDGPAQKSADDAAAALPPPPRTQ